MFENYTIIVKFSSRLKKNVKRAREKPHKTYCLGKGIQQKENFVYTEGKKEQNSGP